MLNRLINSNRENNVNIYVRTEKFYLLIDKLFVNVINEW